MKKILLVLGIFLILPGMVFAKAPKKSVKKKVVPHAVVTAPITESPTFHFLDWNQPTTTPPSAVTSTPNSVPLVAAIFNPFASSPYVIAGGFGIDVLPGFPGLTPNVHDGSFWADGFIYKASCLEPLQLTPAGYPVSTPRWRDEQIYTSTEKGTKLWVGVTGPGQFTCQFISSGPDKNATSSPITFTVN